MACVTILSLFSVTVSSSWHLVYNSTTLFSSFLYFFFFPQRVFVFFSVLANMQAFFHVDHSRCTPVYSPHSFTRVFQASLTTTQPDFLSCLLVPFLHPANHFPNDLFLTVVELFHVYHPLPIRFTSTFFARAAGS